MSTAAVIARRSIIQEVPHLRCFSDGTYMLSEVRASYPHVFVAYKAPNAKPEEKPGFSLTGLIPKQREYYPAVNILKAAQDAIMREGMKGGEIEDDRKPLRNGDKQKSKPEYAGNFTFSARERQENPPKLRHNIMDPETGKAKILIPGRDDSIIYAGCWVNILVRMWWQSNTWGRRVNANLLAVQFARNDEPFGTGRVSDDDVDDAVASYIQDDNSGYDDGLGTAEPFDYGL